MARNDRRTDLDGEILSFGVILGLLIGGLITLLYAPMNARQLLKRAERQVEQVGRDLNKVDSSLSEGRAAVLARQEIRSLR
ncbi:MAG: hypothetical protein SGJ24_14270 [Chloroflexota bacterium]|mgnify:CR=1 FL=1|nr:hypothetical protein [Chloroflexota bacterium]